MPIVFAFKLIGDTVGTIFDWLSQSKETLVTMGSLAVGLGVAMNYVAITSGLIAVKNELIAMWQGKGLIITQGKLAISAIQLGYEAAMGSLEARKALAEKSGLIRSIGDSGLYTVNVSPALNWTCPFAGPPVLSPVLIYRIYNVLRSGVVDSNPAVEDTIKASRGVMSF